MVGGLSGIGIALFFGACAIAFVSIESLVIERHQIFKVLRRVRAIELTPTDVRRRELAAPFGRRVLGPALSKLGSLGRRLTPASVVGRLARQLACAGSPAAWDAERVLAFKLLGATALPPVALVLVPVAHLAVSRAAVLAAILGVAGYYLPEWVLRSRAAKRQAKIQRALPDALDLLSITVEAGLGFDAAVARVARQAGGPLGEELHRMLQEMQIGNPRSEALRSLSDRTTVPELKSFVLAMVQADVFGISISNVLHVQAGEMRLKRRQRAEERAQKIPVKIVVPLIFCIFPSLFVVIVGPAAITTYRSLIQR